jgi:hypothetical protein
VVVSGKTEEPRLSYDDVISAMFQFQFIVYLFATSILLGFLISASQSKKGDEYILVDLSIASIFGTNSLPRRIYCRLN